MNFCYIYREFDILVSQFKLYRNFSELLMVQLRGRTNIYAVRVAPDPMATGPHAVVNLIPFVLHHYSHIIVLF